MSPRTRLTAVLAAGAALLGAGCGGGDADAPSSLAPASAPVYAEVAVRPGADVREDLEAAAGKLLGTRDVRAVLARALARKDLSFRRDVEPWLGDDAALVVTRLREGRPDAAALVATTDGRAALRAVRRGERVRARTHRGVDYGVTRSGKATAVVASTLVAGTEPAVRAVIDVAEGEADPLAEADRFERAREDAEAEEALAFAYVDVARVLRAARERAARRGPQAAVVLAALDTAGLQTLGVTFAADGDALRARGVLRSREPLPRGDGDAAAALAGAPADSVVAVGLGDVGGTAQAAIASLDGVLGVGVQAVLAQLQQSTGLDLQRDVLAWMGDARLYVRGSSPARATAALVVQSKDPAASRAALPKLVRLLRTQGLRARRTSVRGAEAAWRLGDAAVPVVLAAGGERVVLGVGRGAAARALAGGGATLRTDPAFRRAAGLLGEDVAPSVFADPAGLHALLGGHGGHGGHGDVLARVGAFVAGGAPDGELTRFEGLVALR